MTVIKEEKRMDNLAKTYLQIYTEFISGYKQYKMERADKKAGAKNLEK